MFRDQQHCYFYEMASFRAHAFGGGPLLKDYEYRSGMNAKKTSLVNAASLTARTKLNATDRAEYDAINLMLSKALHDKVVKEKTKYY